MNTYVNTNKVMAMRRNWVWGWLADTPIFWSTSRVPPSFYSREHDAKGLIEVETPAYFPDKVKITFWREYGTAPAGKIIKNAKRHSGKRSRKRKKDFRGAFLTFIKESTKINKSKWKFKNKRNGRAEKEKNLGYSDKSSFHF